MGLAKDSTTTAVAMQHLDSPSRVWSGSDLQYTTDATISVRRMDNELNFIVLLLACTLLADPGLT